VKKIKNTARVRVPAQQLAEVVNISEARRQAAIQYREKAREAEAEARAMQARGERIQRLAVIGGVVGGCVLMGLATALVLSW
jgi:hypothetical protein